MAAKARGTNPDEAKVAEIRDRFSEAFDHWDRIYKEGDKNVAYLVRGPWEASEKEARDAAGLPVVTYDEISQYLHQAGNEVRANPRSPIFNPEGDGANDETARFYGNYYRQVEYTSNGQQAFISAYDNQLTRGYAFVRMATEYEHAKSFVQRPTIKAIHNPSACYPDPDGMEPDGSDWKYFFFIESYTKKEFTKAFPYAQFTDFTTEQIQAVGGHWLGQNKCQVAEYWVIEEVDAELVEVLVPATRLKPEQVVTYIEGHEPKPRARGLIEQQRRPTTVNKVFQYITNGVELLAKPGTKKKTPWAGQYLPFAPCYAKTVWLNEGGGPKRELLPLVGMARSPFKSYCFLAACELATIGSITKNPFFAYEGTVDNAQMQEYAKALHEPVAMLLSKPFLAGKPDVLMPLPMRNPMSVDLAPIAIAKENARRAIQAAMQGMPLQTDAQKINEKSGVAMKQIESSSQKGNYHNVDAYNGMLRRIGVIFEDLVDKLLDTEREVMTRTADNKTVKYLVNAKRPPTEKPEGLEVLPSTKGRHSTIVDVGPEIESEREAAAEFLDSFIGSQLMAALEPAKRDKLIALAIRLRLLGPIGTQMAEVIDPQAEQKGGPDPAQLIAALRQAQEQIIPALEAEIADRDQKLAAKTEELASRERIAAASDQTKRDIAALTSKDKRHATETTAETSIDVQAMKNELEALKLRIEVYLASKDREQERNVVGAQLEQSTAMEERGRETSTAEGDKDRAAKASEGAAERSVKGDIARLSVESKKEAQRDEGTD